MSNSTIVISDNIFKNMSMSGPVIFASSYSLTYSTSLFVTNNTFELIYSYIGPAAIQMSRVYNRITSKYLMNYRPPELGNDPNNLSTIFEYAMYGGNILIEKNTFIDIVGCPQTVDTSLIYLTVKEVEDGQVLQNPAA